MFSSFFSGGNPAPPASAVFLSYQRGLDGALSAGALHPFTIPFHMASLGLVTLYLAVPHARYPLLYAARWPLLGAVGYLEARALRETSSASTGVAFASGLVAAWAVLWSVVLLVLRRPQWEARRVERRRRRKGNRKETKQATEGEEARRSRQGGADKGDVRSDTVGGAGMAKGGDVGKGEMRRRLLNGGDDKNASSQVDEILEDEEWEYFWQPFPETVAERLDWALDLCTSFRGVGWNWQISSVPHFPPAIRLSLGEQLDLKTMGRTSRSGLRRYRNRTELFWSIVPFFVGGYFVLDVCKVVMMKDPYFYLGPNDYDLPPHLEGLAPELVQAYRMLLTLGIIVLSLEMTFLLAPIGLCLILGPRVLGLRGEAWMYPTYWGSMDNLFKYGLGGLWGSWWHQTFRSAFSAPMEFLIAHDILDKRSTVSRVAALVIAFGISGLLHMGGSKTTFPHTIPSRALAFFLSQALGILLQTSFCSALKPSIQALPKSTRRAANFAFTFTWLYCTAWLLVDDFARAGIWLYEPIPISPLRGLGFGNPGDGWWCWSRLGVAWYTGKHWWESGIALV